MLNVSPCVRREGSILDRALFLAYRSIKRSWYWHDTTSIVRSTSPPWFMHPRMWLHMKKVHSKYYHFWMRSLLIPLASRESSFGVSAFEKSGYHLKSHLTISFLLWLCGWRCPRKTFTNPLFLSECWYFPSRRKARKPSRQGHESSTYVRKTPSPK